MGNSLLSYSSNKVLGNIKKLVSGYEDVALRLAHEYAAQALADFVASQLAVGLQHKGEFWTNRTGKAASGVWARGFKVGNNIGFFLRHGAGTWYASALEEWVMGKKGATSLQIVIRRTAQDYFNAVAKEITGQDNMFDDIYGDFGADEGAWD